MFVERIMKSVYLWYVYFRFTLPLGKLIDFYFCLKGRSFKSIHQDLYTNWDFFNNVILKNYNTVRGNQIYNDSLRLCESKFPLYVEELKGVADGSGVPFYKVQFDKIALLGTQKIQIFETALFSPS